MTSQAMTMGYIAGLLGVLGCGSATPIGNPWDHTPVPVTGLPDRFIPDSSFTVEAVSDTTCLVHLIDLTTRTRLLLERSTFPAHVSDSTVRSAMGDYTVEPEGRLGIDEDHLLRVLCVSGKPLGKVPE